MEAVEAKLMTATRTLTADDFATVVDRHKDAIVNYLARLTGCRERAEDYAQETFIRFYQKRHRYREEGTLKAYLFRIATNLVRSAERRRRRWRLMQPVLRATGLNVAEPAPAASPQAEALASEAHRQVTRALAALDVLYRAPLVLREIEGLSYHEIAAVLGLSEGTVKSRLHRGRQLLKERLAPYWKGGHDR